MTTSLCISTTGLRRVKRLVPLARSRPPQRWSSSQLPLASPTASSGPYAMSSTSCATALCTRTARTTPCDTRCRLIHRDYSTTSALDAIDDIAQALRLPEALHEALRLYRRIRRHVWIDGRPTTLRLAATGRSEAHSGLPQGCPLAPSFANLIVQLWLSIVRRRTASLTAFSLAYLDDWLVGDVDPHQLEGHIDATTEAHEVLGMRLSMNKRVIISSRVGDERAMTAHVDSHPERAMARIARPSRARHRNHEAALATLWIDGLAKYSAGELVYDARHRPGIDWPNPPPRDGQPLLAVDGA